MNTDAQALVIHHGEHGRQALVRFTHEVPDRFVKVHHASGRRLDTHLVLDRTAVGRVARAQAAVGIDQELRYQEQRNTFWPGRCVRQLGQYQVDDVFGQVMFAARDEDLGPADLVGTVGLRLGARADDAQVGARMRLGQAHGARPDTGIHVRQVSSLQFFTGVGVDRQASARGQHRIEAERQAGRVDHFFDLRRHDLRHPHAAVSRVAAHANPATFGVGAIGFGKARRGADDARVPMATFFVGAAAQGGNALAGDLACFFQNRFNGIGIDSFGQAGQLRPEVGNLKNFIENEAHIAQRRFVFSHGQPLTRQSPNRTD
ncbi:hypothetical protein D9M71_340800 [compost metagenome]